MNASQVYDNSPSKNAKKTAELMPLDRARGPMPRKNADMPPWEYTMRVAAIMDGRLAAEHIMLVLMTSSGVVAAAAREPATAPMAKSS